MVYTQDKQKLANTACDYVQGIIFEKCPNMTIQDYRTVSNAVHTFITQTKLIIEKENIEGK